MIELRNSQQVFLAGMRMPVGATVLAPDQRGGGVRHIVCGELFRAQPKDCNLCRWRNGGGAAVGGLNRDITISKYLNSALRTVRGRGPRVRSNEPDPESR